MIHKNWLRRTDRQFSAAICSLKPGMSFNRSLWKLVGRQIGREARAAMNTGNAFSTFWAPVINLARDPWLPLMTTVEYD